MGKKTYYMQLFIKKKKVISEFVKVRKEYIDTYKVLKKKFLKL